MYRKIGTVMVLVVACSVFAGAQNKASNNELAAANVAIAAAAATKDPNYVIGAQDMLDISVWKEPEFTRTVPVRPDGKISLPLLNDVQASGLTPTQLSTEITDSLEKFMTNPQVTVIVTQTNSQRIYLLGEINHSGAYTLTPQMTVMQAISNAGGPTAFAHSTKIYVLRQENGKQQKIFFNFKAAIGGKSSQPDILLKPGDTVVVP